MVQVEVSTFQINIQKINDLIYDNGLDQVIGGGNIVVQAKK